MLRNPHVYGVSLCVKSGKAGLYWKGSGGNIAEGDRYFLTSVSKLCTSLMVYHLQSKQQLTLSDPVQRHLPDETVKNLNLFAGGSADDGKDITIGHLLSNTSGIPDYLSVKGQNGKTADSSLNEGIDESWPTEKILESAGKQKPKFTPGQKGKAEYSNTNYYLLGMIIEQITGRSIGDAFKQWIFDELELQNTYAYQDVNDTTPVNYYYKSKEIHIPRCLASVTAEGGIVSNAEESMKILESFFNGRFFPRESLEEHKMWNFMFFPYQFYFGMGLEKLWIPWITYPSKPRKELLGFWGSSGAFAFHNPELDLYMTGTVNQSNGFGHKAAYKAMIGIMKEVEKRALNDEVTG